MSYEVKYYLAKWYGKLSAELARGEKNAFLLDLRQRGGTKGVAFLTLAVFDVILMREKPL